MELLERRGVPLSGPVMRSSGSEAGTAGTSTRVSSGKKKRGAGVACKLVNWKTSDKRKYGTMAVMVLGPEDLSDKNIDWSSPIAGNDAVTSGWWWQMNYWTAFWEKKYYMERTKLDAGTVILQAQCNSPTYLRNYFIKQCVLCPLFGGFTFVGEGGRGQLLAAYSVNVRRNELTNIWVSPSDVNQYIVRPSSNPLPEFVHLYACESNQTAFGSWQQVLDNPKYYHGYNESVNAWKAKQDAKSGKYGWPK